MHAPPSSIAFNHINLWARYCLRKQPAGEYVIIYGRQRRGNRSELDIIAENGPCGLCPYYYCRIFKNVGENEPDQEVTLGHSSDEKDPNRVHDARCDFARYVTVTSDWKPEYGMAATNNRHFVGSGITICVQELTPAEQVVVENEMLATLNDRDFPLKW